MFLGQNILQNMPPRRRRHGRRRPPGIQPHTPPPCSNSSARPPCATRPTVLITGPSPCCAAARFSRQTASPSPSPSPLLPVLPQRGRHHLLQRGRPRRLRRCTWPGPHPRARARPHSACARHSRSPPRPAPHHLLLRCLRMPLPPPAPRFLPRSSVPFLCRCLAPRFTDLGHPGAHRRRICLSCPSGPIGPSGLRDRRKQRQPRRHRMTYLRYSLWCPCCELVTFHLGDVWDADDVGGHVW
jgi:hypothetical protein